MCAFVNLSLPAGVVVIELPFIIKCLSGIVTQTFTRENCLHFLIINYYYDKPHL